MNHNEDYYWLTGEVLTEEQFIQDCTDDGLFLAPPKSRDEILDAWEASIVREYDIPVSHLSKNYLGDEPESKRRRRFGENSNALGPEMVNL